MGNRYVYGENEGNVWVANDNYFQMGIKILFFEISETLCKLVPIFKISIDHQIKRKNISKLNIRSQI